MSRAALWKQQSRVKEREEAADEIFRAAIEEGRARPKTLPIWGDDSSFHLNPLLLRNTIQSPYFQKACQNLSDWNAVIDEIYYEVKNLLPFGVDKRPSTAFCLLLRLMTMRMTAHQLDLTLKHTDSPFIRGIGFLYLRYVGQPDEVWQWIEPYLNDQEEFSVESGHRARTITMGQFVRDLFTQRDYYGTSLPRLPIQVERDLAVKLLFAEKVAKRADEHFKNQSRMKYFETLGSRVMALYGDDENPVEWYEAVVDRVITRDEASGHPLKHPKFVVTFPEYGNTETVSLGEMDMLDGNWRHDKNGSYEEVRKRERDNVTSNSGWARRPPSTKQALSSGGKRHDVQDEYRPPPRPKDVPPDAATTREASPPRKRTAEELAAIQAKKRRLMAKYG